MPDRSLAARVCACAKGVHLYEPMQCIVVEERAWCVWPTTVPLALAWHDEGSCHFSHAFSPFPSKESPGACTLGVVPLWRVPRPPLVAPAGPSVALPSEKKNGMQACGGLHAGVVQAKHAGQYCGRPVHAYTHATTVSTIHTMC